LSCLQQVPDRGRIIIVNFEMGGSSVPPEMAKARRLCVVLQNNKSRRGRLVTVVPLSKTEPSPAMPYHHVMDHRSFRDLPISFGQGVTRWAKCDYIATVSLDRCVDPSHRENFSDRRYVKVKAIAADILAIEKCVLWALGIDPNKHAEALNGEIEPPAKDV
jgi:uncharacterized protein YifN (PemK superfamily)